MDKMRAKIKASSAIAYALLLLLSLAALAATALSAVAWWTSGGSALSTPAIVNEGIGYVRQLLLAGVLLYAARIFCRISLEETPFFESLPRKIKLAGVLLFLAIAVPEWASFPLAGLVGGRPSFVFVDQTIAFAFMLAFFVFCLGRVFEYGYLVQDENFEII